MISFLKKQSHGVSIVATIPLNSEQWCLAGNSGSKPNSVAV